jgi:hypothetical protein
LSEREPAVTPQSSTFRTFDSGATRDNAQNKLDFEAFFSPLVLQRRAEYMHSKRQMPGGSMRAGDNWQKGIPLNEYIKSAWRHFVEFWKLHRGLAALDENGNPVDLETALCALMFNIEGYLHEGLKRKYGPPGTDLRKADE